MVGKDTALGAGVHEEVAAGVEVIEVNEVAAGGEDI